MPNNDFLVFAQDIALYQYPELDTVWTVMYQARNPETNQILRRTFNMLRFRPYTSVVIVRELADPWLDVVNEADFHFVIERPIVSEVNEGQYTWTINNQLDDQGRAFDERWEYNRYIGWRYINYDYEHEGKYLPVLAGFIKWGLTDDHKKGSSGGSKSSGDPKWGYDTIPRLRLEYEAAGFGGSGTFDIDDGSQVVYIGKPYATKLITASGGASAEWVSGINGASLGPVTGIQEPKSEYIRVNMPSSAIIKVRREIEEEVGTSLTSKKGGPRGKSTYGSGRTRRGSSRSTSIGSGSKVTPPKTITITRIEYGYLRTAGFIEIFLYTEKIYRTTRMVVKDLSDPVWRVHRAEPDINDPYPPNASIDVPINIEFNAV